MALNPETDLSCTKKKIHRKIKIKFPMTQITHYTKSSKSQCQVLFNAVVASAEDESYVEFYRVSADRVLRQFGRVEVRFVFDDLSVQIERLNSGSHRCHHFCRATGVKRLTSCPAVRFAATAVLYLQSR